MTNRIKNPALVLIFTLALMLPPVSKAKPAEPQAKATPAGADAGGAEEPDGVEVDADFTKTKNPRPKMLDGLTRAERTRLLDAELAKASGDWKDIPVKKPGEALKGEPKLRSCPPGLSLRVRVVKITPSGPCDIEMKYGGEGAYGKTTRSTLAKKIAIGEWSEPKDFLAILAGDPKKGSAVPGNNRGAAKAKATPKSAGNTPPKVRVPGMLFLKVIARPYPDNKKPAHDTTDCELEFEVAYNGEKVRAFKDVSSEGSLFTLCVPFGKLNEDDPVKDRDFVDNIEGLREHALKRKQFLESLPWANRPLPKKYFIVSNVTPLGTGAGAPLGGATCDKQTMLYELECMRQLGINALRGIGNDQSENEDAEPAGAEKDPDEKGFIASRNSVYSIKGVPAMFSKGLQTQGHGYPIIRYTRKDEAKGKPIPEGAGCPFFPAAKQLQQEYAAEDVKKALAFKNVDEIWMLTVDELDPVFGKRNRDHVMDCQYCLNAFRERLKKKGLQPSDFGMKEWSEVKPIRAGTVSPEKWRSDPATALLMYYTCGIPNDSSALAFAGYRDAFNAENAKKQKAIDVGDANSPVYRQPWIYTFSLRRSSYCSEGNGGLDYFDYYRMGENGYVWETTEYSFRYGPFTSLLCDAQKTMAKETGVKTGIYIKPHRGGIITIQRALSAIARGIKNIYWYTYGPDWGKGDNFCRPDLLSDVSKAARLIAAGEDVTYDSSPAVPAEVAWVCSTSAARWMWWQPWPEREWFTACWEDAKWTYVALQHTHVPLDTIDEVMLEKNDLSHYKVMYIQAPVLTREASRKVAQWVKNGGTLYTSAWGLKYDEAMRPNDILQPVLGLANRKQSETWHEVKIGWVMGPSRLDDIKDRYANPPLEKDITVQGTGIFKGQFTPQVGREALNPLGSTEVLARFGDGKAAVTCAKYGQGKAYTIGLWAGLEYSVPFRKPVLKENASFLAAAFPFVAAPVLEKASPVVNIQNAPYVDGTLLKNNTTGKKAVVLANWSFKTTCMKMKETKSGNEEPANFLNELAVLKNLKLTIRGVGNVTKVRSGWLQQDLPIQMAGDSVVVTLPTLEEGDVLLLE